VRSILQQISFQLELNVTGCYFPRWDFSFGAGELESARPAG
jgi:hypothetical protein